MSDANSSLSLYNLSVEGMLIKEILEASEGELTPETEQRLDELMRVAPDRVEAAAMVVQGLQGSALVCQQESLRLAERANALDRNVAALKERIAMIVDSVFSGKIKTHRFTVWTQQAAEHVAFDVEAGFSIDDVERDAPGCVRVKKELDKVELKQRFKDGKPLPPSVHFERHEGKRFVRIK